MSAYLLSFSFSVVSNSKVFLKLICSGWQLWISLNPIVLSSSCRLGENSPQNSHHEVYLEFSFLTHNLKEISHFYFIYSSAQILSQHFGLYPVLFSIFVFDQDNGKDACELERMPNISNGKIRMKKSRQVGINTLQCNKNEFKVQQLV